MRVGFRSPALALVLLSAKPASADVKTDCAAAHAEGQRLQRDGSLRGAREKYEFCARDACPQPVAVDCAAFLQGLEKDQPTITIIARDAAGRDKLDVRVFVDGVKVLDQLTGMAVPLDPGRHKLRFVDADGNSVEQVVVASVGEKNRPVSITFRARPESSSAEPSRPVERDTSDRPGRPIPASFYVLAGASAVALGSFVYFGITARKEANDLDSCSPDCSARVDDVHRMRRNALIADISLGAAALFAGAATFVFVTRPEAPVPSAALFVMPAARGARGGLQVAF